MIIKKVKTSQTIRGPDPSVHQRHLHYQRRLEYENADCLTVREDIIKRQAVIFCPPLNTQQQLFCTNPAYREARCARSDIGRVIASGKKVTSRC